MMRSLLPLLLLFPGLPLSAKEVPLPKLEPGEFVEMRVAYVVNPRLPRMSRAQLHVLVATIVHAVRAHFGVELRFGDIDELPIADVFARLTPELRRNAEQSIYDFKRGGGDRARLARAFGAGLRQSGESLNGMVQFARPHLGERRIDSFEALGAALAALQLQRIQGWRDVQALDGGPAIDAAPYNEFLMWVQLGYTDLPYELLLTNQIIASVEYSFPAVHAAIRGGYSNGVTTYSRAARFKTASIWSTFGFTSNDKWVKGMRNGETYGAIEAARLAGISAAHEIGHQLFHFLHPFGQETCLMNPVPLFAYRAWAQKLDAEDCPIGSSPAMRPGAYKFVY
jgi:hypothetical protein